MEYILTILSALADPVRLRCLALLERNGETCVCELTPALAVSQPSISKHLATLRDAGLVRDRREAQWVHYSIAASLPDWVATIVTAAVQGVRDTPQHHQDLDRLTGALRPRRSSSV